MRSQMLKNGLPRLALALLLVAPLAACAGKAIKHGHVFTQEDVDQVRTGMTKDQVQLALGTPDTTSTIGGDVYYYISSTTKGPIFLKPKEVDRRVVAIYFNKMASVDKIAHYGLQDGKVFDFISRKTPSHGTDLNIIQQLLGNFGNRRNIFGG